MVKLLTYSLVVLSLLTSCGGGVKSSSSETDSISVLETYDEAVVLPSLEYRVAKGYFAASDTLPSVLTSQGELEQHLGMATTMVSQPTKIDWTSEFVIPIVKADTNRNASIVPVSLGLRDGHLELVYKYLVAEEDLSYSVRPFCAVIVSRELLPTSGIVVMREIN